jgi:hypothetical protein
MGSMSAEKKQNMMRVMTPKMMSNMMGSNPMMAMMSSMMGEGSNPMMGMMSSMMGKKMATKGCDSDAAEMPWDMCKKMMSNMSRATELASYATPELHGLFEEWLSQVEEEMQADIQKQGSANPEELAKKYKLSKESIYFILAKLAQKDKINLKAERK